MPAVALQAVVLRITAVLVLREKHVALQIMYVLLPGELPQTVTAGLPAALAVFHAEEELNPALTRRTQGAEHAIRLQLLPKSAIHSFVPPRLQAVVLLPIVQEQLAMYVPAVEHQHPVNNGQPHADALL